MSVKSIVLGTASLTFVRARSPRGGDVAARDGGGRRRGARHVARARARAARHALHALHKGARQVRPYLKYWGLLI